MREASRLSAALWRRRRSSFSSMRSKLPSITVGRGTCGGAARRDHPAPAASPPARSGAGGRDARAARAAEAPIASATEIPASMSSSPATIAAGPLSSVGSNGSRPSPIACGRAPDHRPSARASNNSGRGRLLQPEGQPWREKPIVSPALISRRSRRAARRRRRAAPLGAETGAFSLSLKCRASLDLPGAKPGAMRLALRRFCAVVCRERPSKAHHWRTKSRPIPSPKTSHRLAKRGRLAPGFWAALPRDLYIAFVSSHAVDRQEGAEVQWAELTSSPSSRLHRRGHRRTQPEERPRPPHRRRGGASTTLSRRAAPAGCSPLLRRQNVVAMPRGASAKELPPRSAWRRRSTTPRSTSRAIPASTPKCAAACSTIAKARARVRPNVPARRPPRAPR